jgi:hypothetical protein
MRSRASKRWPHRRQGNFLRTENPFAPQTGQEVALPRFARLGSDSSTRGSSISRHSKTVI